MGLAAGSGKTKSTDFPPLPAKQRLCKIGNLPTETACLYWNMGNGMLLVVAPDAADAVVQQLTGLGYAAQVAGRLTAEAGVTLRVGAGELRYR